MEASEWYYLVDQDGGEHAFFGTFEDAQMEAREKGYDVDDIHKAE